MAESQSPATRELRSNSYSPRVGDYNQLLVFDTIRRSKDGISRAEVVAATGLSPQTVSNVVSRLLDSGWVIEGARVHRPTRGKPRTLLHSNADAGFAVGVHVEPALTSAVLMDVNGVIRRTAQTPAHPDPQSTVKAVGRIVAEVSADIPREKIMGIGCSVPGPLDLEEGIFIDPPTLPGWDQVAFREMVFEETGITTYMQKDSIAALSGELWNHDHNPVGTTLFVYAGFGIGFAAAHKGELFVGGSGNAGEAGHIKVDVDSDPCTCGRRGCVGKVVEFEYMVQKAEAAGVIPRWPFPRSQRELISAMDQIVSSAAAGNPEAAALVEDASSSIAQAVVTMADFLDATDVIIGGTNAARLSATLGDSVREEFDRYSVIRPIHALTVHDADFGAWVGAAGGASLVFDAQMSPTSAIPGNQTGPGTHIASGQM